jgi:hypothetical protein
MVHAIKASSSSILARTESQENGNEVRVKTTSLPVIENLGNQAKTVGDHAAPACGPCWVACLAGPQAPFCAAICAAMCFSPLAAQK